MTVLAADAANGTALATIRYTPGHFFFDQSPYIPGLYRILVVTVLAADAANGTALATIRYTPGHFFFLISMLLSCLAIA